MDTKPFRILVINPGSTSTKVAVFEDEELKAEETIRHNMEELADCKTIFDQKDIRTKYLLDFLERNGTAPESLDAVVGRGGITKPIPSGTFSVNEQMLADLSTSDAARHASSLGGIMANEIGKTYGKPAYVVDPVVVDELGPLARYSGIPQIKRRSIFHALNQKAIARRYAKENGKGYEDIRVIVVHLGGGISVGAHQYGRVVDVNDALGGEGPFSPERCGALPVGAVVDMCFSGDYARDDMLGFQTKTGGVRAYLGHNDMFLTENKAIENPDGPEAEVLMAMAYQICKDIGGLYAVLDCDVDAILLTGGLARCKPLADEIIRKTEKMAPVLLYPGEDEMLALAQGALRVLTGAEKPVEYK